MALMRTKKNGEPPSKVTVKTKREASKPNVENQKKIAAYESAMSKNKAVEDKYKSDVEAYGKKMKVYSEQPKGRKDMTTLFQGGGRYLNPTELADWNKQKAGERGGLEAKKVYVSKGYGKESSDKGKFSSDKGGTYSGYLGASHEFFDKPTAPSKFKTPTVEKPKLGVEKMPIDRVTSIKSGPTKLAVAKEDQETPTWENPSRLESKTKWTSRKASNANLIERGNLKSAKVFKSKGKIKEAGIKYNREEKQFKSYYGAPASISGSDRAGMTAEDLVKERGALKEVKKELKADIKKTKPGGTVSRGEIRSELKNVKKDIRSIGKAQKYAAGNIEARSVEEGGQEKVITIAKKNGTAKFFKPEMGEQYSDFSKSQFRMSEDNPANRNTLISQEKKLKKKN
jgi:hypothetical protein